MLDVTGHAPSAAPGRAGALAITDITDHAAALPGFDGHEKVILGRDPARGLTAIVALHNTVLGPALGGTRIWSYPDEAAAITDVLRLSRGMTLKAAIAQLPYGGGKAVIMADPKTEKTPQLLDAYADFLSTLAGEFVTAEDVGLTTADADYLRLRASNISGTTAGGSGNPAPFTARGVFLGIKAALRHNRGHDHLDGMRVAIQGLGSVGWLLAEQLHDAGARLIVGDIDAAKVARAVVGLGAEACQAEAVLGADADIFAPCALGAVLDRQTIPQLKGDIVAGSANNQLAGHGDAGLLAKRGILYAPDYVINAGGLINVAAEFEPGGYDPAHVEAAIGRIPEVLAEVFERARREGRPTNAVAQAMAEERIAAA